MYAFFRFCQFAFRSPWAVSARLSEHALTTFATRSPKRFRTSSSRAYYAVFLASVAALIKLTDFRPKDGEWRHGSVQAELNRQLIMRRKVLPAELGRTPTDLIELRHLADYKADSVSAR